MTNLSKQIFECCGVEPRHECCAPAWKQYECPAYQGLNVEGYECLNCESAGELNRHLVRAGENSWLAKKYGKLNKETWQDDIKRGFDECMRVLRPQGTLIFKWAETQIPLKEILKVVGVEPLITHSNKGTHFLIFYKGA